jgi:hypothetical protein
MGQRLNARVKMVHFKKLKELDVANETAREMKEVTLLNI